MHMSRSGSPQNPTSEMMIPLSSACIGRWCNTVQSKTSFCREIMPPQVLDTVPYSDSMTFSLLTSLCMISGRSPEQAVEALGRHLIVFSLRCGHGRFLKAQGATLPIFLSNLGKREGEAEASCHLISVLLACSFDMFWIILMIHDVKICNGIRTVFQFERSYSSCHVSDVSNVCAVHLRFYNSNNSI